LSFFDEADEPRTRQRPSSRRRSPSGGGGRPPADRQAIQTRRAVAAIAGVVILILIILGIHSCQVSARNSALKDYNNNVAAIVTKSLNTGAQLFGELAQQSGGAANAANLQQEISRTANDALSQLKTAQGFSVPSEAKTAQVNLLLALEMRHDAMVNIANNIQQALATNASQDAVKAIAEEMARLYTSDVVYKDYVVPPLRAALQSALGANNGEQQNLGQVVHDLTWLSVGTVAQRIHATLPTTPANCSSNKLYGHKLDSVSVNGTTLSPGTNATIPRSPAPKFTFNYTNGGDTNEANVKFDVTVNGTSSSGQTIVPSTTAGASGSTSVTLKRPPAAGTYTVIAKIVGVPCEKNTDNNSETLTVTFQ
jgi:hypothetical protein